ncbi:polyketide cyclase, partial [Acinetobacter baumannii]|nr:polyketide cyclase [Acinetobacter baumannii]
ALVAVHSKLEMQMNDKLTILAVVHICRFENGKIAEFWDIGQIQPDPLVNENGMF